MNAEAVVRALTEARNSCLADVQGDESAERIVSSTMDIVTFCMATELVGNLDIFDFLKKCGVKR